jgi:DNA (cytosine-5)-methyltransferase 1
VTIGSLFSGIGGLELGLERAGLGPVVWQCERDPFARSILRKHWPDVPCVEDVHDVWAEPLERAELICGGFPCQDVSAAGSGAGLAGARSGLWYEFLRVVDVHQPAVVVVENVTSGQKRWLPHVLEGLEDLGYVCCPLVLPAGRVGAPHLRRRTFVVADTDGECLQLVKQWHEGRGHAVCDEGEAFAVDEGEARHASDASAWSAGPTLDGVGNGLSRGLDPAEYRSDRFRVLGNAVVPQCAEIIGRLILAARSARPAEEAAAGGEK